MTAKSDLAAEIERLSGAQVLVLGDVMLDRFVYGAVDRVSPEAPVPVLKVSRQIAMLGGAGNVVRNLAALGGSSVFAGVIGADEIGQQVAQLLSAEPAVTPKLVTDESRPTSLKTRFVAGTQQLLRTDQEETGWIHAIVAEELLDHVSAALPEAGAVVISDYGKGTLTEWVLRQAIEEGRAAGKPVIVDPKGRDYALYKGATVVTPNRKELAEATGMPTDTADAVENAARQIIEHGHVEAVLCTRGPEGMTLVGGKDEDVFHVPAEAREVFDVSGAGDTVVAVLAAALAAGIEMRDAVRLANAAAGVAVGKVGTAVVYPDEIAHALHMQDLAAGEAKLVGERALLQRVESWRARGLKVGFTNGCFDLLHPGHVSLLRQARKACDRLVVGLNNDASVTRLKGDGRPVQSEAARAAVLGSLADVDLVVLFAEDTPVKLIEAIEPDVLIKGADYTEETVVGADIVKKAGGKVVLAELLDGHSTTETVKKLKG